MGFYGNIADRANASFKFDRIFPNRMTMDDAADKGTDNIFPGRFVLVQYDPEGEIFSSDFYTAYIDTSTGIAYADLQQNEPLYFAEFSLVNNPESNNWASYWIKPRENFYIKLNNENEFNEGQTYYQSDTIHSNLGWENRIIQGKNFNDTFIGYYICTGENSSVGLWEPILNNANGTLEEKAYFQNYIVDRETYNDFTIGYDATIWEKVYVNGKGSFQLVAHLNGMMPKIQIISDPPSDEPKEAYIDSLSNDGLYRIHVPSSWGFRIKEAGQGQPSDQKILQTSYTYNSQNEITHTSTSQINADIYFNKAGNNIEQRVIDNTTPNEIKISSTGKSGKSHYTSDGTLVETDTKELSIHMPAIGNMIAHGYDLIYGVNNSNNTRYRNIRWYDGSASDTAKTQGDATYGPKTHDLNTIAGCLNTIHDRLGQIVYHLEDDFSEDNIAAFSSNFIYEKSGRYYRIGTKYRNEELVYDPSDPNSIIQYRNVNVSEEEYIANKYYIIENGDYVPASGPYNSATPSPYYLRYINSIRYTPVYNLQQFQPQRYYLREGENWICDNSASYPAWPDRIYYESLQVSDPKTFNVQYDKNNFFIKDNNNYIKSTDDIPSIGTTYYQINSQQVSSQNIIFYTPNKFYKKNQDGSFTLVEETDFTQVDYNITYYVLTFSTTPQMGLDGEGNPIMYYAKTGETEVTLSPPPSNLSSLYFQDDNGDWISYNNLNTYSIENGLNPYTVGRKYYTLTTTSYSENLYLPNVYYIKNTDSDSVEYLSYYKATGNLVPSQEYYLITGWTEVNAEFYVPDKYWRQASVDNYVLASEPTKLNNTQYYQKAVLYAKDEYKQFPDWYEWNDYVPYIPPSVSLYKREEYLGLVEIKDFENNTNSINGMILNLSKAYDLNDEYTRDIRTYRGVFNKISDMLYQIHNLKPGQLLYVNEYGQIDSLPIATGTNYYNYKELKDLYTRVANIEAQLGG